MGKLKKQLPNQGKKIKITPDTNVTIDYPVFCLRHLHKDFSLDKCTSDEKVNLLDRFYLLSTMSWNQIQLTDRHKLGSEKIEQTSIRASIPPHITKDVVFLSLRFDSLKPFIGYRSGSIFHIIYIDTKWRVYNHS